MKKQLERKQSIDNAKRNLIKMNSTGHRHWDYLWNVRQILEQKYAIFPCRNMIKNIGYGKEATHTKEGEDLTPVFDPQTDYPTEEIYDKNFSRRMIEKKYGYRLSSLFKSLFYKSKVFVKKFHILRTLGKVIVYQFKKGKIRQLFHCIIAGNIIRRIRIHNWLKSHDQKFLQIGGGNHIKSGDNWINGDLIAGDIYLNATKKFPFPSGSLDIIFTEQFIEHLTQEQALYFLTEAYSGIKTQWCN
ncbi:MAG: hypothetical protein U5P41_08985 [Gammaproteobacteria bacterium]|nr:hypothetical protein [Gammaproteobacteria bacterium]